MQIVVIISVFAVILVLMTGVFLWYYRLSQKKIRELEAARREAAAAGRFQNDFLSSMSYDVRTPMNAIIGMTEIALKNTEDTIRVEECLHKIKLFSKRLLELINEIPDVSILSEDMELTPWNILAEDDAKQFCDSADDNQEEPGARAEWTADSAEAVSGSLDGRKILLAEDIEINWEVADAALGEFGLELEWAENGKECVDMFTASEIGYYDAVLMDLRMPVMNGYEAAREIRGMNREDRNLPIIAMTADVFSGDVQRSRESGMNAHIAKPIDAKECIRTLMEYIK
ncbi:MAG: response regulator [Lachnospiraceae bacterium]|nr:response regulator [Lachnospiraceae bacterium]